MSPEHEVLLQRWQDQQLEFVKEVGGYPPEVEVIKALPPDGFVVVSEVDDNYRPQLRILTWEDVEEEVETWEESA